MILHPQQEPGLQTSSDIFRHINPGWDSAAQSCTVHFCHFSQMAEIQVLRRKTVFQNEQHVSIHRYFWDKNKTGIIIPRYSWDLMG